jgi:hypothetical protein
MTMGPRLEQEASASKEIERSAFIDSVWRKLDILPRSPISPSARAEVGHSPMIEIGQTELVSGEDLKKQVVGSLAGHRKRREARSLI